MDLVNVLIRTSFHLEIRDFPDNSDIPRILRDEMKKKYFVRNCVPGEVIFYHERRQKQFHIIKSFKN